MFILSSLEEIALKLSHNIILFSMFFQCSLQAKNIKGCKLSQLDCFVVFSFNTVLLFRRIIMKNERDKSKKMCIPIPHQLVVDTQLSLRQLDWFVLSVKCRLSQNPMQNFLSTPPPPPPHPLPLLPRSCNHLSVLPPFKQSVPNYQSSLSPFLYSALFSAMSSAFYYPDSPFSSIFK